MPPHIKTSELTPYLDTPPNGSSASTSTVASPPQLMRGTPYDLSDVRLIGRSASELYSRILGMLGTPHPPVPVVGLPNLTSLWEPPAFPPDRRSWMDRLRHPSPQRITTGLMFGRDVGDAIDTASEVLRRNLHPIIWMTNPSLEELHEAVVEIAREMELTPMRPQLVVPLTGADADVIEGFIETLPPTHVFLDPDPSRPELLQRFLVQRPLAMGCVAYTTDTIPVGIRGPVLLMLEGQGPEAVAAACTDALQRIRGALYCLVATPEEGSAAIQATSSAHTPLVPVLRKGLLDPWPRHLYGWPNRPGRVLGAIGMPQAYHATAANILRQRI